MATNIETLSVLATNKQIKKQNLDRHWHVVAKASDSLIKLRISPEMLNRLKEHAEYNGRTTNNEILVIIRDALINSNKSYKN